MTGAPENPPASLNKRPLPITFLALIFLASSFVFILGATAFLVEQVFIPRELSIVGQITTIPLDRFIALAYALGIVLVVLWYGLWHLKQWAIPVFVVIVVIRTILGASLNGYIGLDDIIWFLALVYLLKQRQLFRN